MEQKIEILYQDDDLVVVNKPSGLLVHPYKSQSNERDNLLKRVRDQIGAKLYPIHRIDRPASGIVAFGLKSEVTRFLKERWHSHEIIKRYIILSRGLITQEGEFDFALTDHQTKEKKESRTRYRPLENFEDSTLLEVEIFTGRKHQIRRHFSRRMHAVIGDTCYGKGDINRHYRAQYNLHRLFLHSYYLRLPHPTQNRLLELSCPLPKELSDVLSQLKALKTQIHQDERGL